MRTVQRTPMTVQRKPTSNYRAVHRHIAPLEAVKAAANIAHTAITSYATEAVADGDAMAVTFSSLVTKFDAAYQQHKAVIDAANAVTASADEFFDDLSGVVIGTIVGLAAPKVLVLLTAKVVLQEALGELIELGVSKVVEPDKSRTLKPSGLTPEAEKLAASESLKTLYRDIAKGAAGTQTPHEIVVAAGDLIADVRAHATSANRFSVAETAKLAAALTARAGQLRGVKDAADQAQDAVAKARCKLEVRDALSPVDELERDIWVQWLATRGVTGQDARPHVCMQLLGYHVEARLKQLGLATAAITQFGEEEVRGVEIADTAREAQARALRGRLAHARADLDPNGPVEVDGEIWSATLAAPFDCVTELSPVRIVGVDAEKQSYARCEFDPNSQFSRELPVTLIVAPVAQP